jgi:predicted DCC family thiol-disulfide oxidoreductase YuxK
VRARRDASWIVFYDADCGLCTWLLAGLLAWDHARRLRPVALASEEARKALAALTPQEQMASWHLLSPAGRRWSAGGALAPLLRLLPGGALPARLCDRFPGVVEAGYRWAAGHRSQLGRLVPAGAKRRASARVLARAVP